MGETPDMQRMIGDLVRLGAVASVDLAAATCRVRVGDIVTGDLPWLAARAGAVRTWSPPSVGEQVVLLSPESDAAAGIVLLGLYADAAPAPSDADTLVSIDFPDRATLSYDSATHELVANLPDGATVTIHASGGLALHGDVTIAGKLTVTDDVIAAGVSLKNHRHGQVQAGGALSGKPAA